MRGWSLHVLIELGPMEPGTLCAKPTCLTVHHTITNSYRASNKCDQQSMVLLSVASVQARMGSEYAESGYCGPLYLYGRIRVLWKWLLQAFVLLRGCLLKWCRPWGFWLGAGRTEWRQWEGSAMCAKRAFHISSRRSYRCDSPDRLKALVYG